MSIPLGTHNFKAVLFILGGFDVTAYGDDGKIACAWGADLFDKMVGTDGGVVVSRTNDDSVLLTVDLLETSQAYRVLAGLMNTQLAAVDAGLPIPPLALLYRAPNGDEITDPTPVFMKRPELTQAKGQTNRSFEILCPNGGAKAKFGSAIL